MGTALMPAEIAAVEPSSRMRRLVKVFLSGRNARTLEAYRKDLWDFQSFLGAGDLDTAAARLLLHPHGEANALALEYRASLLERGLKASTVNRRLAAVRSLVKLARTLGLVSWTLEVPNVRAEAYRDTRGPGRDGFRRMLEALSGRQDAKSHRDRAILRLLYDLGLRRSEAVGLDLDDADLESGHISVRGKGRSEKQVLTLPEPTKNALKEWLGARGLEKGPLFPNFDRAGKGNGRLSGTAVYYLVRRCGDKVGLKVRSSFGT